MINSFVDYYPYPKSTQSKISRKKAKYSADNVQMKSKLTIHK